MDRSLKSIPFREFQFQLVLLIPHSAIVIQSSPEQLFFIFLPVHGKSTFKTRIKTIVTHYFFKLTKHFIIMIYIARGFHSYYKIFMASFVFYKEFNYLHSSFAKTIFRILFQFIVENEIVFTFISCGTQFSVIFCDV